MEKERKQKILDALALIKDICKELECDKCPFRINDAVLLAVCRHNGLLINRRKQYGERLRNRRIDV